MQDFNHVYQASWDTTNDREIKLYTNIHIKYQILLLLKCCQFYQYSHYYTYLFYYMLPKLDTVCRYSLLDGKIHLWPFYQHFAKSKMVYQFILSYLS